MLLSALTRFIQASFYKIQILFKDFSRISKRLLLFSRNETLWKILIYMLKSYFWRQTGIFKYFSSLCEPCLRQWFYCCWFIVYSCSHCLCGFCVRYLFCYKVLSVLSIFAIILVRKRGLVSLLLLSSWCLVNILWLFGAVQLVGLWCVIVVFPGDTPFWRMGKLIWILVVYIILFATWDWYIVIC